MNVKQAAERWEIKESYAKKICANMQVDPENIPEDLVPVYVPDKNEADPHILYLALLNVIMNTHLELEGIDPQAMETCLAELRKENLIVAKNGRPANSSDYHDYILSPDRERFYNWYGTKTKNNTQIDLLKRILRFLLKKN